MKTHLFNFYLIFLLFLFSSFYNILKAQQEFFHCRGEKIQLEISPNEIAIKFKSSLTNEQIKSFLTAIPSIDEFKFLSLPKMQELIRVTLKSTSESENVFKLLKDNENVEIVNKVYKRGEI